MYVYVCVGGWVSDSLPHTPSTPTNSSTQHTLCICRKNTYRAPARARARTHTHTHQPKAPASHASNAAGGRTSSWAKNRGGKAAQAPKPIIEDVNKVVASVAALLQRPKLSLNVHQQVPSFFSLFLFLSVLFFCFCLFFLSELQSHCTCCLYVVLGLFVFLSVFFSSLCTVC